MIAPICRCTDDCPGYRVARQLGVTIAVRCPVCWSGETLAPDDGYYGRQPEVRQELAFEAALAAPSRCLRCREPAPFGNYFCELCLDDQEQARQDALRGMMFTTLHTLQRSTIQELLIEADRAGDMATVRDCRTYLRGNEYGAAAKRLLRVINDTEAQQ